MNLSEEDKNLEFVKDGKRLKIEFDICENKLCSFSFGGRPVLDMMGENEEGEFKCASSGAWVMEDTFAIKLQVIDTYFGCLNVHISFKDERATMSFEKNGQYVFDGIGGYVIGKQEKKES